jgi:hypothetical protein
MMKSIVSGLEIAVKGEELLFAELHSHHFESFGASDAGGEDVATHFQFL